MEAKLVINPTEYTILETLGEGLSGCVYKAIRSSGNYTHSQKVALKILNSGTEVSKWRIEIEQGMRIQSSYCSSIYGWEISGTQLMIVNQYIDGVTLQQFWENYDVSVDEAIEILRQVLLGIKDLEKNSYSHGDLSLGNIMIDKKGHVFLIDYSKPSSCFEITPEFAAPEVLMGQDPDTYSDLFSVGRILQKICPKIDDRLDLMPLLEPLPLNRKFYESVECEHARSQLAKKVQTLQKKKERSSRTLRWMDNVKRRSSWRESSKGVAVRKWVVAFLAPIYVMGVVSASPEFVDEPSGGVVSVVTSRWYQVVIEGRNLGYTPLNKVFLPEGSYLVQWTSSSDVGERQVEIVTGQHLVLSDSFFDSGRHPKRNR